MLPISVFQSVFDRSPIGEYLLSPDGTILAVNDAFLDTASRKREDLVGVNLFVAFPENPQDAQDTGVAALRRSLEQVIATGEPDTLALQRYPIRVVSPDGGERFEERFWSAVNTPIFDGDGKLLCIFHSTVDVTALVSQNQKAEKSAAAAEKLAHLEASMFTRAQTVQEVNKALRAERSRLRHLFERAPGFVYFTQGPDHVMEQANSALYELVGERAIIGKSLSDAFPELAGQNFLALHDEVYRTGKPYIAHAARVLLQPSPGAKPVERYVDLVYQPILDADGKVIGICGQGNDITEKKYIEEQLRETAARQAFQLELADRMRSLEHPSEIVDMASEMLCCRLDMSRVVFVEVDDGAGTMYVRRAWNRHGLQDIAGEVRRYEELGIGIAAALKAGGMVAIDDIRCDRRTAGCAAAYDAAGVRSFAAIPLLKSGRLRAVLALHHLEVHRWSEAELRTAQDTAERTWSAVESARAQAELRMERDQSQHIFDSMTEGFALLDSDWRLLRFNAIAAEITRRPRSELIGHALWEAMPELVGTEVEQLYRRVRESGVADTLEYMYTFPGGEQAWSEIRAYPLDAEKLAVFFRDITRRKRTEEALRDASRRKDEFLAMLAHELRNPLAPISAAAELMEMVQLDEARLRQTSQVISRQVRHMTALVDDLLDVSRVTRGLVTIQKSPQDLKSIVSNAVEQVQPFMEAHRHHFVIDLAPEPVQVMGDQKRLVQVLTNLLNNAAKYTPPGGNIRLVMEADAERVLVHVQDNGIGIAADQQAHMFELFAQAERTADRAQGGLGLGLALVKSLAELHGGEVRCHSEGIGKGSCFTLCLPRRSAVAEPSDRPAERKRVQPAGVRLRILVVDDNADAAHMLTMLLQAAGHEVLVEQSPRAVLERARQEAPDVCILDIGLPEIDGNTLARRLRAQKETEGVLLIAVTGYGQEHDRQAALAAGFDHHLIKPVDAAALGRLLQGGRPDPRSTR